ncbi:MAG: helix-turn-helix domain-containing protein [Deltaproteobacteria bacterium]|nr:helix-turn-helix domain-containing protein [Deltaproteobacteria bacterium]
MNAQRDFGKYLSCERELRQVPLAEVAEATKIPKRTLELLEAGEWEDLPAEVFVRGFVRSYAQHLGLPEGEATARYSQVVSEVEQHEASRVLEEVGDAASEVSSRPHFGLALFVIILLIIVTITFTLIWGSGANANTQANGTSPAKVAKPPATLVG